MSVWGAVAKGAGFVNETTATTVEDFEEKFLQALRSAELHFIVAKVEPGVGDVPPAPLDSQENKYTFVRYVEKAEKISILGSPHSRAYDRKS